MQVLDRRVRWCEDMSLYFMNFEFRFSGTFTINFLTLKLVKICKQETATSLSPDE
jgi:hypothetical protein